MEIKNMNFEELETRRAELAEEISSADAERLDAINLELDSIEERKKEIKAEAEERAKVVEEVINSKDPTPIIEERNTKMTSKEIRSTQEYIDAYVEYAKRNYDLNRVGAEARALLTENADPKGTIAVPTYVEERINTAWENDEIMRRVRRTFIPGNVKVGVEVSASGAVIHREGTDPIEEENLNLQYANLVPDYIKKMVRVSHSALALTGTAFLDYLYDEIEYQLVKAVANTTVYKMCASELNAVIPSTEGLTTTNIIMAEGRLGGEARDVVLITNRGLAAAVKAAAIEGKYAYDPFDGLEVLYADLPAGVFGVVADLSGVQANFPEGAEPKFIFDEYTEAPANMVRIIGRLMAGVDLVAVGKVSIIGSRPGKNPEE